MNLTTAQKLTLKTNILASPDCNGLQDTEIAALYNLTSAPANTSIAWKTLVALFMVGKKFSPSELAGLTQLNTTRLQNLAQWFQPGIDPSDASMRQFFDDIFSGAGGVNTRAALLALWKRSLTRAERLFATGTGSDASPATPVVEGTLTAQNVSDALGGL